MHHLFFRQNYHQSFPIPCPSWGLERLNTPCPRSKWLTYAFFVCLLADLLQRYSCTGYTILYISLVPEIRVRKRAVTNSTTHEPIQCKCRLDLTLDKIKNSNHYLQYQREPSCCPKTNIIITHYCPVMVYTTYTCLPFVTSVRSGPQG